MKNKALYLTLLIITTFIFASCAGSRSYGTQRKGYGCPANASIQTPFIEKNQS
jgi:hypothetical protein